MFPPPTGEQPDAEQIRELDDSFFSSDPLGYFQARIESLIAYADRASADYSGGLGALYARSLRRSVDDIDQATDSARQLQVAVDALSLRQQAAEALIRLWVAALQTRNTPAGAVSFWATLSDGKTSNIDVLRQIPLIEGSGDPETAIALLLPEPARAGYSESETMQRFVGLAGAWLQHAEWLLRRTDVNLAAAHNKTKHGLAVRARDDVRMDVLRGDAPITDGTMPVSAAQDSIPLVDRPLIEYLARPPRDGGAPQGLELTWLKLDPAKLLVEATMLPTVYAAVFHVAAARYAAWSDTIGPVRPYPVVPLSPTPQELLDAGLTGLRFPVTYPPGHGSVTRPSGLGYDNLTFQSISIDYTSGQTVTLVDG